MHYRTTDSCKLKINFGFKLHDVSNFKEQTKLERIKDAFEGEMCKLNIVFQAAKLIFIFMIVY